MTEQTDRAAVEVIVCSSPDDVIELPGREDVPSGRAAVEEASAPESYVPGS